MKNINQSFILLLFIICLVNGFSQTDDATSWKEQPKLRLLGFADVFYVNDFNEP